MTEEEIVLAEETRDIRDQLWKSTKRAQAFQVALVALAGMAVIFASTSAVWVGLGNRNYQQRIKDCTEPTGHCFQQTQKATGEAVQVILDYVEDSVAPLRLRLEADHHCLVELFDEENSSTVPLVEQYDACVTTRSPGSVPPPAPPNPLTSTTTTTVRPRG